VKRVHDSSSFEMENLLTSQTLYMVYIVILALLRLFIKHHRLEHMAAMCMCV